MLPDENNVPPKEGIGFEILGEQHRVERISMVTDDQVITPEFTADVIARLERFRKQKGNPRDPRKLFPLGEIEADSGISESVVSEVIRGTYKGDRASKIRELHKYLARQESRDARTEFIRHASIGWVRKGWGVIASADRCNRNAAVIGESGSGKTNLALAYERENGGATYIRMLSPGSNDRDVSYLICGAIPDLQPYQGRTHRHRVASILKWIPNNRGACWLIDEAQNNDGSGLEMWRTFHDAADPAQRRGLPIIFFGDEHFESAIVRTKGGQKTAVAPQFARRMLFVFNIDKQGGADDGGPVLSVEDILKIVHSGKIRLITADAARWFVRLANTPRGGHLGQALDTLRVAIDIAGKAGVEEVGVTHLQIALEMNNGKTLAKAIDGASGGLLLRKTA